MHDKDEKTVLSHLIKMNSGTALCYASIVDKIDNDNIRRCFLTLESLHRSIADDLAQRMSAAGAAKTAKPGDKGAEKPPCDLHACATAGSDDDFIACAGEKVESCLKAMRVAILENDIKPLTRILLFRQLNRLQIGREHITALGDLRLPPAGGQSADASAKTRSE